MSPVTLYDVGGLASGGLPSDLVRKRFIDKSTDHVSPPTKAAFGEDLGTCQPSSRCVRKVLSIPRSRALYSVNRGTSLIRKRPPYP